jgi:hypothetical protein
VVPPPSTTAAAPTDTNVGLPGVSTPAVAAP